MIPTFSSFDMENGPSPNAGARQYEPFCHRVCKEHCAEAGKDEIEFVCRESDFGITAIHTDDLVGWPHNVGKFDGRIAKPAAHIEHAVTGFNGKLA